jgi:hypothetical protein
MRRCAAVLAIGWLLLACGGNPRIVVRPSGNESIVASDVLRIRFPLPPSWQTTWQKEPTAMIVAASPDAAAKFTVTLDPLATTVDKPLAEARSFLESKGAVGQTKGVEGTVSGRKAVGYQVQTQEGSFTVFAVDHDRGIYLITLASRTAADAKILDDMFARLEISGD